MRTKAEFTVALYSDNSRTREKMRMAIGRRPAPDVGAIDFMELGRYQDLVAAVDAGKVDLVLLDGEAQPTGGMAISRQLDNEVSNPPPVVLVLARAQDRWLATWSRADAMLSHPLDPIEAARVVAEVLRGMPARANA